jgi:hypothetical protein
MKIGKCRNCIYFQPKDWSWGTLSQKLFGVVGFCMDSQNPDFNYFAQCYGRGIGKCEAIFSPEWCRLRKEK